MLDKIKKAMRHPKRAIVLIGKLLTERPFAGHCTVCGNSTLFYRVGDNLRETFKCRICGSVSRNRHLAKVLCDILGINEPYSLKKVTTSFPRLKIYEAQASGAIHNSLKDLSGYICSEFFSHVPPGALSESGIRCEDLQNLSLEDSSFDVVITQDVFEHIRNPELAWKEIHRVLKPSGYHIFTIPYSKDRKTVRRVELDGENEREILPKIFHGDGVRDGLVYTDFGYTLVEYLDTIGFSTQVFWSDDLDIDRYRIYWSCVFVSKKL